MNTQFNFSSLDIFPFCDEKETEELERLLDTLTEDDMKITKIVLLNNL